MKCAGGDISVDDMDPEEHQSDDDEPMYVFVQGLKVAADARKALPTKRSLMSVKVDGKPQQCVNLFTPIKMINTPPCPSQSSWR